MTALSIQRSVPMKETGQAFLATLLRLAGWLVANALIALGMVAFIVFAIGTFSIEGAMHHLANLSTRYIAAGSDRQHQFDMILVWSLSGTFFAAGVLRRQSLCALLFKELDYDR